MTTADELTEFGERWRRGERSVEVARRLVFLAWYCEYEPPFATAATGDEVSAKTVTEAIAKMRDAADSGDLETAMVLGYLAAVAPWSDWAGMDCPHVARCYLSRASEIAARERRSADEQSLILQYLGESHSLDPRPGCFADMFTGDSEYDEYFAGIFSRRKVGGQ